MHFFHWIFYEVGSEKAKFLNPTLVFLCIEVHHHRQGHFRHFAPTWITASVIVCFLSIVAVRNRSGFALPPAVPLMR